MMVVFPNGCPPDDAPDADMEVYYVVKDSPCVADDFKSQAERGRALNGDPCNRCGVSVWHDEADARQRAGMNPRLGT